MRHVSALPTRLASGGIAVTTPARTVADLRRSAAPAELRRAIRQAGVLGLALRMRGPATGRGVSWSAPSCSSVATTTCRGRRSTSESATELSTSSGATERLIVETDGYRYHPRTGRLRGRYGPRPGAAGARLRGSPPLHRPVTEGPRRVAEVLREALRPAGPPEWGYGPKRRPTVPRLLQRDRLRSAHRHCLAAPGSAPAARSSAGAPCPATELSPTSLDRIGQESAPAPDRNRRRWLGTVLL